MGWVVNATSWPLYPRGKHGTHCIGGWVGPRAGLNRRGKSRPPSGFDPRTVQPVANRYTDTAIPAHCHLTHTQHNSTIMDISCKNVIKTVPFIASLSNQLHRDCTEEGQLPCSRTAQKNTLYIPLCFRGLKNRSIMLVKDIGCFQK
jgi:hypothetical protein